MRWPRNLCPTADDSAFKLVQQKFSDSTGNFFQLFIYVHLRKNKVYILCLNISTYVNEVRLTSYTLQYYTYIIIVKHSALYKIEKL